MLSDYVYDNDFDGFDEGQYMLDLVECAPDIDTLLERVKQGMIYRGFVASTKYNTGVSLKEAEVKMMVDPTHVPWDAFHTGLLHSIFDNRASNKTNAATCTRSHSDEKMRLMQELHEAYPSSLSNLTDHRKQTWISGVDALAVDFIREFENIVVKGGGDILKEIEKVLGKKWEPTDDEHARTIYYVCGAVYCVWQRIRPTTKLKSMPPRMLRSSRMLLQQKKQHEKQVFPTKEWTIRKLLA